MKKLLVLLLLSVVFVRAQSDTINLGSHGKLTIYLPDSWKVNVSEFGEKRIITIEPKDENVNAGMTMTFDFPERDLFSEKRKLKLKVEAACQPYIEHSVEEKAAAQEFRLRSGTGFYCNFTDPDLIGKPPEKGNYKTISVGIIRLAPDVTMDIGINADGFKSRQYQDLLGAVEGMEYEPASGNGRSI